MDKSQQKALKLLIEKRIASLENLRTKSKHADDAQDDSAENGRETASTTDSLAAAGTLRELARLSDNLKWLESEDAGYCLQCGCEIPIARLQAMPTTRLCINCAE